MIGDPPGMEQHGGRRVSSRNQPFRRLSSHGMGLRGWNSRKDQQKQSKTGSKMHFSYVFFVYSYISCKLLLEKKRSKDLHLDFTSRWFRISVVFQAGLGYTFP